MSEATAKLPDDDPRVVAFAEYKDSEEYTNTFKWAFDSRHRDGSLWAAFIKGWEAAERTKGEQDK